MINDDFLAFLCIRPNFVFKAQVVPEYDIYYYYGVFTMDSHHHRCLSHERVSI